MDIWNERPSETQNKFILELSVKYDENIPLTKIDKGR